MVALGVSVVADVDIARELAQETMLRAHAHWDEVCCYERPDAWLRRVMTNLLIDHLRATHAERRALERLRARPAAPLPEEHVDGEWRSLLAILPPRQRIIVALYYGQDISIEHIARDLQISEGTVKSALGKARARLQQSITKEQSRE
jgi:RNA polymerase sigma-70 factor (ECF subfamily)